MRKRLNLLIDSLYVRKDESDCHEEEYNAISKIIDELQEIVAEYC